MEVSKEIVQQRGGKRDTMGEWGWHEGTPSWQRLGSGVGPCQQAPWPRG